VSETCVLAENEASSNLRARVVVSVSRRTNVWSRSRLEKNCQRLGLVSGGRRLGLGHLIRLVPKTKLYYYGASALSFLMGMQAVRSTGFRRCKPML